MSVVPAPSCRSPWCRAWYDGPWCGAPVMQRVGGRLVVLLACSGQRDRVLCVVQMNARCAGRDRVLSMIPTERPFCRRDRVQKWLAHAGGHPNVADRSAEHAHAADRFAREIVGFLTVCRARLRRLMGTPFGVRGAWVTFLFSIGMGRITLREGALCRLRRAEARGAGRGTSARCANCPWCRVWYERPWCGLLVMQGVV